MDAKKLAEALTQLHESCQTQIQDDPEAQDYFRFTANLKRADRLNKYMLLGQLDNVEGFVHIGDDIRRSSIVFLHAALEDYLRCVARRRLPLAPKAVIDEIPLESLEGVHASKFWLGDLVQYKEFTVGQIIAASIDKYLLRKSFTSFDDIRILLRQVQVDSTLFEQYRDPINRMMKRRHRIVHEADLPQDNSAKPQEWTEEDESLLLTSTERISDFGRSLFEQIYVILPAGALTHDAYVKRHVMLMVLSLAAYSESADYLLELEKRGMSFQDIQEMVQSSKPELGLRSGASPQPEQ